MVQISRQRRRQGGNGSVVYVVVFLIALITVIYSYINRHFALMQKRKESKLRYRHGKKFERKKGCGYYGCKFQPMELKYIQQDLEEIKQSKGSNIALSYGDNQTAALTQQGKDHAVNQDRGIIISPFYPTTNEGLQFMQGSMNDFLIAIFDGHGDLGHEVSQYLQENFHVKLSQKLSNADSWSEDRVKTALKETFVEIDKELPDRDGKENVSIGTDGGSTGSVVLRLGSKIYFANTGDSLSFLTQYDKLKKTGEATIVHKNRFDKPNIPEEKERIERMGGKVFIPPHPENSRVVAFYPLRNEHVTLGMSRAIGDYPHGEVGVIAEPIIDVLDLDEIFLDSSGSRRENIELFVVSSCDGLYDHRRPQFVANHFARCFYVEEGCHPVLESVNIVESATPQNPKRYRDDITVMALKIVL